MRSRALTPPQRLGRADAKSVVRGAGGRVNRGQAGWQNAFTGP
jgi:hypothetical protein